MSDLVRMQILLEKNQPAQLEKIAEDRGVAFSELVRDFLNAQLRQYTYEQMRRAAQQLYADYWNDEELSAMTSLDGEEFFNE